MAQLLRVPASQACWYTPLILALMKQRLMDLYEFKTSLLVYIVDSRTVERLYLKRKKRKERSAYTHTLTNACTL